MESGRVSRRRRNPEERRRIAELCERSGLSQSEFAKHHGLSPFESSALASRGAQRVVRQILVRSLPEVRVGLACVKLGMPHAGNVWRGFLATGCYGHRAPAAGHERGEAPEGQANDLLTEGTRREAAQLDEKLYLGVFAPPAKPRNRNDGRRTAG